MLSARLLVRDIKLVLAIAKAMTVLTNFIFRRTRIVILPFKSCNDVSLEAT
ncbi:MAG: hypothetical protein CLLPBCKN_006869 [Chroococcidiopsis cubana SAG 39.79]|nr:hypothetical protein [Chroococcidiopsis cubana SAG 39.79]